MSQQLSFWSDGLSLTDLIFESPLDATPSLNEIPSSSPNEPVCVAATNSEPIIDLPFEAIVEDLETASTPVTTFTATEHGSSIPVRDIAPWPATAMDVHEDLRGTVTKFNANVLAIQTLKELELANATPNDEQRRILNRYTGWGGIKEPFATHVHPEWRARTEQLKSLLNEAEFKSAGDSILSAHYTPLPLVRKIWEVVQRCGFSGGRIIEPSGGTGFFLGTMPEEIVRRSDITAVELDSVSARIMKMLYGHASTVHHSGLEKLNLPEAFYDLAISNVPFGDYHVGDLRRKAYSNFTIHNYFIARALELVRPGGLVAVLTSSFFMDANTDMIRKYIAHRAKLIGAFRLPAGMFSQLANADVVVDFVLLQRRECMELLTAEQADEFVPTKLLQDEAGNPFTSYHRKTMNVNNYWLNNRSHVIGQWQQNSNSKGPAFSPVLDKGVDVYPLVDKIVESFPQSFYIEPQVRSAVVSLEVSRTASAMPMGSFVLKGSDLHVVTSSGTELSSFKGVKLERASGMCRIRDTARALISEMSRMDADDRKMGTLRFELNTLYDLFVKKYGIITSRGNRLVMARDPSWPLLLSLEMFDPDTLSAKKADIFFERTVFSKAIPTSAETVEDALAICIAELGVIDSTFIGQLLGRDGLDAIETLRARSQIFLNPETKQFETRTEYLSGNVRAKLKVAAGAGAEYQTNVDALTAAIPKDLTPTQIDVMLGMTWISTEDLTSFAKYLYEADYSKTSWATYSVTFNSTSGAYAVSVKGPTASNSKARWGTSERDPAEVLRACLNSEDITISYMVEGKTVVDSTATAMARLKQDEVRAEFKDWFWRDEERALRNCALYNELFNCWAPPVYDGSYLRLPGYSNVLAPRVHQLNAVARMVTGKNTILSHCVGAGKTLTMIMGTMELKRLGIAKKPWHVVQNSTLEQYCAEFIRAYPNANVLMATKADLKAARRREFVARCAVGSYDAVIITQSSFEKIAADRDVTEAFIRESIDELQMALEGNPDRTTARTLKKTLKDWEAKLEKMEATWKKDDFLPLSATGVDYLAIDEAHMAKNLYRISRMKNITGLSNSNSQRALDVFLKCKQMMRLHGNKERGICMASGTLVSNSLAELHTFQRFTQPETLKAAGLDQFDSWAAQFGRAVTSLEVAPDGSSFRMAKRFKQFANIPELLGMFRMVADIQTKEMLQLPVPKLVTGAHQTCVIEPSVEAKAYVAHLVERAEKIQAGAVKPNEDNMLSVTSDGQKVALDERLVMPHLPYNPNGKIGKCVDNVYRIYEMTQSFRGTQLIFSDRGTPKGKGLNLYQEIKNQLIAKGVPADEIAFIHDYDTDAAKALLFSKVRAGLVRVLVGSTEKCGTGTNIQTRLYAVHHLTTPWRPSDMEQRDGRIERQGNTCEAIEIWRYVTNASFDAYMFQTLAAKAGFINQVFAGNAEIRTVEDALMATLTYEEVKGLASGNPAVREKATLDAQIMQLALQRKQHQESVWSAKRDLNALPGVVYENSRSALALGEWISSLEQEFNSPRLVIAEKQFNDVETVEKILTLSIEQGVAQMKENNELLSVALGNLYGSDISLIHNWGDICIRVAFGYQSKTIGAYRTGRGLMRGFEKLLADLKESKVKAENSVVYWEGRKESLEMLAASTFAKEAEMDEKIARSSQIALELGLLKATEGTSALDESTKVVSELIGELAEDIITDNSEDAQTEEPDEEALA